MDSHLFDALTRVLGTTPSRRALLPLLGGLLASPLLGNGPAAAKKKKKKKKKTTLCLDGQTIKAGKKKKKQLINGGATPGPCPPVCAPTCPGNTCGVSDGCGGTCACAAGSLCLDGVCQSCTVTCEGQGGGACGAELQQALDAGGTVIACPGRYLGSFLLKTANLVLIGAGEGEDPATNTILDANGTGGVLRANLSAVASLERLRLTGGNKTSTGAGVVNQGVLTFTACTITANDTTSSAGGIHNQSGGQLTLIDCTLSANSAGNKGGGLFNDFGATATIYGGAITDNSAVSGGGIFSETFAVSLNGPTFSGNTPENCVGVIGC